LTQKTDRKKDFNFFYDVLKLVSGNGFVQVFRTVLSPVISRLYLPKFLGLAQNFSSIANIFAVIAALRYDRSIMLPKDEKQAANQFGVSVFFSLITAPIFMILVFMFGERIALLMNSPELVDYLWLIPLYVFAISLFVIFKQWNARKRKYMRLSISQAANEIISDGTTVGLGFAGLASGISMILSRISGQVISALALGFQILKEDGKFFLDKIRWKPMRAGINQYRSIPIFGIWSALLSTMALYLPGIILSAYFSPTNAGYFALGQTVLRLPIALVGTSIGQVFFQRGADAYHKGRFSATIEETMKRLIVFGLFPMLVVMVIGEELFAIAFGAVWSEAGEYSQILSIWTLLVFISIPLDHAVIIIDKNEMNLIRNMIKVIAGVGSLIIGGITGNVYLGLWLFSITGILNYTIFLVWLFSETGVNIKEIFFFFLKNLLASAPFIVSIFLFNQFNPIPDFQIKGLNLSLQDVGLAVFAVIMGIIYYLWMIMKDKTIFEALKRIFESRMKKKVAENENDQRK